MKMRPEHLRRRKQVLLLHCMVPPVREDAAGGVSDAVRGDEDGWTDLPCSTWP